MAWNGAPVVAKNVVLVGAAHRAGTAPRSRKNAKGYIRGFDARTGKRLWIFHTIPQPGEFGNDTWLEKSWEYTGNTGVWTQMTVDEQLGIAYLPVEDSHRRLLTAAIGPATTCSPRAWSRSICRPASASGTTSSCTIRSGTTTFRARRSSSTSRSTAGRSRRSRSRPSRASRSCSIARPASRCGRSKSARSRQGTVPREWYSPTQPFPTKPPPFERHGFPEDMVIDFTPELKAEALKILAGLQDRPDLHAADCEGRRRQDRPAVHPERRQLAWRRVRSRNRDALRLFAHAAARAVDGERSEAIGHGLHQRRRRRSKTAAAAACRVQGLPLIKPPYGRISAIDLNKGEIAWQIAHGETPDAIKNHPALKGLDIPRTGRPGGAGGSSGGIGTLVTKTLVISGEGGTVRMPDGSRGAMLRAYDKKTGAEVGAVAMPGAQTGSPMTYMLGGKQYIVVASSSSIKPGELIAYKLP